MQLHVTVTHYDGSTCQVDTLFRDAMTARRILKSVFGVDLTPETADEYDADYMACMVYAAAKRMKLTDLEFDPWYDSVANVETVPLVQAEQA